MNIFETIKTKLNEYKEKNTNKINLEFFLKIVVCLIVLVLIFQAGVEVGFHKASFGQNWNRSYVDNFGPKGRFPGDKGGLPSGHGASGKVLSVGPTSLSLLDRDGTEKVVVFDSNTEIQKMHMRVANTDIVVGDSVVVIGEPNTSGQVVAKFIRIFPSTSMMLPGVQK